MSAYLRGIVLLAAFSIQAAEPTRLQRMEVPAPPWPADDEPGMAVRPVAIGAPAKQ